MSVLSSAAELAGLILLALAVAAAGLRRRGKRAPALRLVRPAPGQAGPGAAGAAAAGPRRDRRPALVLVEDRVPGAAALQLEEPVGAGDEKHAVPQPRGVIAARDR